MKKYLVLILFFVLVTNAFGSPLIYKARKEISKVGDFVEIGRFDASKYKQIRIAIIGKNSEKNPAVTISAVLEGKNTLTINEIEDTYIYKSVVIDSPRLRL